MRKIIDTVSKSDWGRMRRYGKRKDMKGIGKSKNERTLCAV